LWHEDLVKIV